MTAGQGIKERGRPSRWHRPLWWSNIVAVVALMLAYLSTHTSPVTFWPLALFGMAYPFLLVANILCIAWWLVFRRKRVWPSLLVVLIGAQRIGDYVQVHEVRTAPAEVARPFKVMSYNVRLFDLYNWTHSENTRDDILELLRTEDADILCLQEFLNVDKGNAMITRDTILNDFRYTGCADAYTAHTKYGHHFGIATFSTYPIVARGSIQFKDDLNNLCVWSDIAIGPDTVRVYNGHLASIRFGDQDYRFMKDIAKGEGTDSLKTVAPRILDRLKNAFIRRSAETERIVAHIRASPHPVVWCGDLNDTPMSYSYHTLRGASLRDAFVESGSGIGHTYIGAFPSFRIDHIMHGPALKAWDFHTLPDELSDHHPIMCRMGVAH